MRSRRLGSRADPRAAVGRARLLAGAGAGDEARCSSSIPFEPGQRLLDVGSNTCWASNILAAPRASTSSRWTSRRPQLQGLRDGRLRSSRPGEVYFERAAVGHVRPGDRAARASTTSSAARSCTTTTRRTCGARCASATASCAPAAGSSSSTSRCASCLHPKLDHAEEVARVRGQRARVLRLQLPARRARRGLSRSPRRGLRGVRAAAQWHPAARGRSSRAGASGAGRWRHVIYGDRSLFLDCRKPGDAHDRSGGGYLGAVPATAEPLPWERRLGATPVDDGASSSASGRWTPSEVRVRVGDASTR